MRALVLAALLLPGAAAAQDVDVCAATWAFVRDLDPEADGALDGALVPAVDGWCEALDLSAGSPGVPTGVSVDRLRWRGEGLKAMVEGTGLPTALEMEVEGFRVAARTGDPAFDWLLAAQSAPYGIDGRMALRWDAATREVRLETLEIDLPGRSALRATAVVAAVDLSSMGAAQASLGSMNLTLGSVEVVTDGLFETWLLMPSGLALLTGSEDPATEVKRLRAQALAAIGAMPDALAAEPSRAAMAALVEELPNPLGRLTLEVEAVEGGGLGPTRLARFAITGMPRSPGEVWEALEGVRVTVGWEPLPPAE